MHNARFKTRQEWLASGAWFSSMPLVFVFARHAPKFRSNAPGGYFPDSAEKSRHGAKHGRTGSLHLYRRTLVLRRGVCGDFQLFSVELFVKDRFSLVVE